MQDEWALDFLSLYTKRTFSAIETVKRLFFGFPELIYIHCTNEGHLELHYNRKRLYTELNVFWTFNMTSFERGLKHAGLYVIRGTHGRVPIKIWGIKKKVYEGAYS
jgi:hypothetical protein